MNNCTSDWIHLLSCIYRSDLRYDGNKAIKFYDFYIARMIRYGKVKGLIIYKPNKKSINAKSATTIFLYKENFYNFYRMAEENLLYDEYLNIMTGLHHYNAVVKAFKENRKHFKDNIEYKSNLKSLKEQRNERLCFLLLNSLLKRIEYGMDFNVKQNFLSWQQIQEIENLFKKEDIK